MKSKIELYVSQKVKEYRIARGWSHQYLGDIINLSRTFVANRENSNSDDAFNLDHINALAVAFGCSVWELLPQNPFPVEE